jgi:predicted alpha/beta superfamily hydrolase
MGIMRRYRMFPYEIKQTPEGKYYGIVYTIDGKSISGKTDEFIVEHDVKAEVFKIIDEKRDALDKS